MKKMLGLISLCICLCMPLISSAQTGGSLPGGFPGGGYFPGGGGFPGWSGIIINPIKPPVTPPSGSGSGRSMEVEVVKAWVDYDFGQIAVCFAEEIGKVTISVQNAAGQTVSSRTCDTAMEWEVYLPAPNMEGHYRLYIDGSEYAGIGEFDL